MIIPEGKFYKSVIVSSTAVPFSVCGRENAGAYVFPKTVLSVSVVQKCFCFNHFCIALKKWLDSTRLEVCWKSRVKIILLAKKSNLRDLVDLQIGVVDGLKD